MEIESRKMGIDIVGDVPWGTHLCQFYQAKGDLINILVPYFKAGLENNEFCMWVTSEPLGVEEAETSLKKAVKNLDSYIKSGQMEILKASDWYTKSGKFDPDGVLQGWLNKENQALERGFDGLRLTGDTSWLLKEDWEAFFRYEAIVNDVISNKRMLVICSYSLDRCGVSEVVDVVNNHVFTLIRRDDRWRLVQNTEHKRVKETLLQAHSELEKRVAERTADLETIARQLRIDVAERKQTEEELRKSNEFNFNLIEQSPHPILVIEADSTIVRVNQALEKLTGYPASELIGLKVPYPWWTEQYKRWKFTRDAKAARERKGQRFEERFKNKNGEIFWVEVTPTAIMIGEKPDYYLTIWADVTERKLAEEELRKSEEFNFTLIEQAPNPVIILKPDYTKPDYTIIRVNRALEWMTGYSASELIGRKLPFPWRTEKDVTAKSKRDRKVALSRSDLKFEEKFKKKNGEIFWVEVAPRAIIIGGKFVYQMNTWTEITERKQAEEEVGHLNRVLRTIRNVNQLIVREKERDKLLESTCATLIKNQGYDSTCICLFDESGMLVTHAEAGLGKDFLPVVERLKRGELTDCIKRTLIQSGVVITKVSSLTCGDCPLVKMCSGKKVITVRIEHGGKVYGLLKLQLSGDLSISREEQSLLQEVTGDIAFAIHDMELEEERKRLEHNLNERIKELQCLFSIASIAERPGITWDEIYQEVANLLPQSWQYPEIACARIIIGDKEYKTENCTDRGPKWKQSADIKIHGAKGGVVEVGYLEERPALDEGPFQKEERLLIDAVAERLGTLAEHKQAEEVQRKMYEYEELSKLKTNLLSTVSHELRTPLATIKGYSTMLLDYDTRLKRDEKRFAQQLKLERASLQDLQGRASYLGMEVLL